jgi:transcriptional regulator with XRE-family HTH domain/mannose-6-phosphate isomerase-like protein (cupin superfamily)
MTGFDPGAELGPRLRRVRETRGLSIRELARRTNCSPSLISQIERGLSAPSVGVLYALATELRTSLDFLFGAGSGPGTLMVTAHGDGQERDADGPAGDGAVSGRAAGPAGRVPGDPRPPGDSRPHGESRPPGDSRLHGHGAVQRAGTRRTIDLASGVRWERLTPGPDERVDFLEVIYSPSGHSTDARRPLRHDGQEYGLIISGRLHASIGFEEFELGPGDSVAFDSAVPHLYWNATGEDVHAVWVVVHAHPGLA